jgi:hypothetical protein
MRSGYGLSRRLPLITSGRAGGLASKDERGDGQGGGMPVLAAGRGEVEDGDP